MNKKQLRLNFKIAVFERDNYTCKICNETGHELEAHHITDRNEMPNGGYVVSNGITVCKGSCHLTAELFHISGGKKWAIGFHPDDLYKMIGSSKEQAIKDSKLFKE